MPILIKLTYLEDLSLKITNQLMKAGRDIVILFKITTVMEQTLFYLMKKAAAVNTNM